MFPLPAVIRDPKDNSLFAYALVGDVEYLVTGDADLLVLRHHVSQVKIVTPRGFVKALK